MAGKLYQAGRGPIVVARDGTKYRIGVDDDGNVTQTVAHPLLDDDYFPRVAAPEFVLPNGSLRRLVEPFFTPPEMASPAGTFPAAVPGGVGAIGTYDQRPPLISGDGQTFFDNETQPPAPLRILDQDFQGPPYYVGSLHSCAWFRIHAKTAHPITLDTIPGYPDSYPSYAYYPSITVFEGGTANNGVAPVSGQFPYYSQPIGRYQFSGSVFNPQTYNYDNYAQGTFTPVPRHYYFVCVSNYWPRFYGYYYGYAAYSRTNCLRWAGINQ